MRYQLLEVISLLFSCFFLTARTPFMCTRVFPLPFCLFVLSFFLIEKCLLMPSPSVKWGAAWPQIIMTFAVCFLPECHSVTENTACKKKKKRKKRKCSYTFLRIQMYYLKMLRYHLWNWLWMCKDSFLLHIFSVRPSLSFPISSRRGQR